MNLDISPITVVVILVGLLIALTRPPVQVLENTKTSFIFRLRITFLGIIAAFFMGAGFYYVGLASVTLSSSVTLTCDRPSLSNHNPSEPSSITRTTSPRCNLREFNLLGLVNTSTSFHDLQGATIATVDLEADDNPEPMLQIMLQRADSSLPFGEYIKHFKNQTSYLEDLVTQINDFVDHPFIPSLKVQDDIRTIDYLIVGLGTGFWLLSFLIIALPPVTTCRFDAIAQRFTLERRSCFNLVRLKTIQQPISNITEVTIEYGNHLELVTSRIVLTLKSGETLALTSCFDSQGGKNNIVVAINQFLKHQPIH